MNIIFENATIQDFKSLLATVNEFYRYMAEEKNETFDPEKSIDAAKKHLRKFLKEKNCNFLLCKSEEAVLGYSFISIEKENSNISYINELFVVAQERSKGIGYSLLLESIKYLTSKNCKKIILTVSTKNRSAMNLYRKVGFSVDEFYYVDMNMTI